MKLWAKVVLGIGVVVVGTVTLAAMALGIAIEIGAVPDTKLRRGEELRSRERDAIAEHVGLEQGETVLWYYSSGLLDHAEDMNLITDRRVVSHQRFDGETYRQEARYEEIVACEVLEEGHVLLDTTVYVLTGLDQEEGLILYLSAEGGRDELAIGSIRERMAAPMMGTDPDREEEAEAAGIE